MSGPHTRTRSVSPPISPIPQRTLRWRSRAAGIASGSPPDSPPMSSGGRAPGSPSESLSLTTSQSAQVAPSQGAPSQSQPQMTSTGTARAETPIGIGLDLVEEGLVPDDFPRPPPSDRDVSMEPASSRDLARVIRVLAAWLPGNRDAAKLKVEETKGKVDAAASDGAVVAAFPRDYQSDVREYLQKYRAEVETLANARSSLEKLRKHRTLRTYPPSLNSINTPSVQFSRTFLNAPAEDSRRGQYQTPAGATGTFEHVMDAQIKWVKVKVLQNWISEEGAGSSLPGKPGFGRKRDHRFREGGGYTPRMLESPLRLPRRAAAV
jgi:hypothetical protein